VVFLSQSRYNTTEKVQKIRLTIHKAERKSSKNLGEAPATLNFNYLAINKNFTHRGINLD